MWIYLVIFETVFLVAFVYKLSQYYAKALPDPEKEKMNIFSLKHKNAVISGEFFPMGEETLKNKLVSAKTNVMPQMSAETDILICGKFPDWSLIQEAKIRAIKVVFVDKASDLFAALTSPEQSDLESELTFSNQFPLGI